MSARLMMIRHWHLRNGHKPREGQDYCEGCAYEIDDLLKHMDAAGYAVVPKEPTEKMYIATCDAWEYHGSGFDQFKREYAAMLTAAKETP